MLCRRSSASINSCSSLPEVMSPLRAAAFDLEGTVVDVEIAHHKAHILAAQDVGVLLTMEDCFKFIPHFIGGPDDKVAEDVCKIAEQQGKTADKAFVLRQKEIHYFRLLKELTIQPREGFLAFFQELRKLGLKCTIGSVTNQSHATTLLERSGIGTLFGKENIVLREDVKNPKPAPDVWIATAKKAGVLPEQQIVFEDSPRGIQGAIQIGAYCIGMPVYNRPDTISALVQAGAKRIFLRWEEIDARNLIKNIQKEISQR